MQGVRHCNARCTWRSILIVHKIVSLVPWECDVARPIEFALWPSISFMAFLPSCNPIRTGIVSFLSDLMSSKYKLLNILKILSKIKVEDLWDYSSNICI